MKVYQIIGGMDGVGKSSFLGVLKGSRKDLGVVIDVDRITANMGGNMLEGGKAAVAMIKNCLEEGISFTQETPLSGYKTEKTAKAARDLGYTVRLYYIGLDTVEESLSRIENRVRRGGHNIHRDDVLRRYQNRWEALKKVLPYCHEGEFYDNDNGFVKVAEYRNGELLPIGDHRPQWLCDLIAYLKSQW